MCKKTILIGAGILGTGVIGYKIGKNLAYIKCVKYGLDFAEELLPGFKKTVTKKVINDFIDSIFDKKSEKEKTQ